MPRKINYDVIEWNKLQELHNNGIPFSSIAKMAGICVESLYKASLMGKITQNKIPPRHTEETKKLISAKRRAFLSNNPDKHTWKRENRNKSVPCEKLKLFLKGMNISFIEEHSPLEDRHYSIDIAFPDKKIGIEVNGNQHYDKAYNLLPYYQQRHDNIVAAGWILIELHYKLVFDLQKMTKLVGQLISNHNINECDYSYSVFEKPVKTKKKPTKRKEGPRALEKAKRLKILHQMDFCDIGWKSTFSKVCNIQERSVMKWIKNNSSEVYDRLSAYRNNVRSTPKKINWARQLGLTYGGKIKMKKEHIDSRLALLSSIDMNKLGWVTKAALILGLSHTQVRRFVRKHYKGEVYTRK